MIALLSITLFLACNGLPDHVIVERNGVSKRMPVVARFTPDPVGQFSYDILSGNDDIRLHSRVWVLLRMQNRGVQTVNGCDK